MRHNVQNMRNINSVVVSDYDNILLIIIHHDIALVNWSNRQFISYVCTRWSIRFFLEVKYSME